LKVSQNGKKRRIMSHTVDGQLLDGLEGVPSRSAFVEDAIRDKMARERLQTEAPSRPRGQLAELYRGPMVERRRSGYLVARSSFSSRLERFRAWLDEAPLAPRFPGTRPFAWWVYAHDGDWPETVALRLDARRVRMSEDELRFHVCWGDEFLETQLLAEHELLLDWEVEDIRERAERDLVEDMIKLRVIEDGLSTAQAWALARFDFDDDPERLRAWKPSRT
jgi:hypothetical protein